MRPNDTSGGVALREPEPSALRYYGGILWRRRWFLLVPLVVLPLVGFVTSKRQTPVYSASSSVLLNHQALVASSLIGVEAPPEDEGRYADTQAQLATVPAVARRVLAATGIADLTAHDLIQHTSATPYADLLVFDVKNGDPGVAARLAGAFARQFTQYRHELDTKELARTLGALESRLAVLTRAGRTGSVEYRTLSERQQQVSLLAGLRKSEIYVVRTPAASDAEQLAPRPLRNAALLGAAGLVLGLLLVALVHALDTRVVAADEVEEALGIPLLGRIRAARRRGWAGRAPEPVHDAYAALATSVALAAGGQGARSLLVAGGRARDDAGPAAAELALALARAGSRVLLVDLDLRHAGATRLLGLEGRPGFVDAARWGRDLTEVAVPVPLSAAADGRPAVELYGAGELQAVGAGAASAEAGTAVAAARVGELLRDAEARTDLLVVAGPPLLEASEALAVSAGVDGLVLLVRSRSLRSEHLGELRRLVDAAPAHTLGFAFADDAGRRRTPRRPSGQWRPAGGRDSRAEPARVPAALPGRPRT